MDPALQIEMAAMSRQKPMNDVIGLGDSEIQKFYNDSVVFITGGSGFIGKQLIEKLFRSCNISKIYMLLRSKKGKNAQQRLEKFKDDPVFEKLRKEKPDFVNNIVIVSGDIGEKQLNLSTEDWNTLIYKVDVIFHVAATTKFDETLQVATFINVRGTKEMLKLGKACKKLKTFVYVSTAYSHANSSTAGLDVDEQFYTCPVPPEAIISMAENMDVNRFNDMTPELIKNWPNTYTFTKAIAEELVRTTSGGLPICIMRPGIVISSYTEPSPGWIDRSCINSATAYIVGGSLGLLHTVYTSLDTPIGLIPCDYVTNAIMAAGRETATNQAQGGNDTRIYTITSVQRNPITWRQLRNILEFPFYKLVSPAAVGYIYGHYTENIYMFTILSLLLHLIPAYIADIVCLMIGKERRFVKIANKVFKMTRKMLFFVVNKWKFIDDNTSRLYNNLSHRDKVIFNFDVTDIDWAEFVIIWFIGTRKYIFKDGLKNTERAITKQKWLRVAHYIFMTLYLYSLWKFSHFVFYIVSIVFNFVCFH